MRRENHPKICAFIGDILRVRKIIEAKAANEQKKQSPVLHTQP